MKRAIGLTYKEAPRAALCPNHYSHMADPAPIISYATPEPAARRGQPIFWWLLVDFILMIAFVVALFAVEPERSIDPPNISAGRTVKDAIRIWTRHWVASSATVRMSLTVSAAPP